jgi:predicted dehydrogenase
MTRKTIKAGIIGSGFAARFHCEALRKVTSADVEIVGVFSPTAENCKTFAAEQDVTACDSLDAVLDRAEVIHVCTPPATHEAITLAALALDKFVIVEKPLTGYFGDGSESFRGDSCSRQTALDETLTSVERLIAAEQKSAGCILYAENWIHAPSIQKEREIIEKTGSQILWIHGQEAHSGSHSEAYGDWKRAGGGSLVGKASHPLAAALYLKRVEGRARDGKPIQPSSVTGRTHSLTRLDAFRDEGHLRTDYHDVEDFAMMHVVFEDGTVADLFASEVVMGGVHNVLEVAANNHHTRCNINPNTAMETYNPREQNFKDIYVVEKIGTKQGWLPMSPDEDWFTGYPQEMDAFYRTVVHGHAPECDSRLAADTISVAYSAYLSDEKGGAEVSVKTF